MGSSPIGGILRFSRNLPGVRLVGGMSVIHPSSIEVLLRDGTAVVARPLVPGDRASLAQAWQRLSPESRYNRFWTHGGDVVGDRMLDRVLRQDPAIHIAWAVLDPTRDFPPMGGASWWRDGAAAEQAEFSAVVLDGDQNRGIGTLLLAILWRLARREGIRRLTGYSLTENRAAADWMRDTGAEGHWDGYKLVFTWNLESITGFPNTPAAADLHGRLEEFEWLERSKG